MPKVFCTETGRGPKGSIFVCWTSQGDVVLRAKKVGPNKYDVFSEVPYGKYKITMYASDRRDLRRKLEDWLETLLG